MTTELMDLLKVFGKSAIVVSLFNKDVKAVKVDDMILTWYILENGDTLIQVYKLSFGEARLIHSEEINVSKFRDTINSLHYNEVPQFAYQDFSGGWFCILPKF